MIAGVVALIVAVHVIKIVMEEDYVDSFASESPALLALMIALVSLLISHRMFTEQRRMRQAGTDPVVIVHLTKREDSPSMIMLSISNVGAGAALNVLVKPTQKLDERFKGRVITDPMLVKHPIGVIPQNEAVEYHFGAGHMLLGDDPVPPFDVDVEYSDIDGFPHHQTMTIDVRGLEHQGVYKPSLSRIADSLEKVETAAEAGLSSTKPRYVVTQTIEEKQAVDEEKQAAHEERQPIYQRQLEDARAASQKQKDKE
jgi:hypothetical protein